MSLPRLSLCTAALLLALSTLNAQSVTTAPVGAVTKTINVGLNSVGLSLINPDLVVANCSTNTANAITLDGIPNVGALLTSGHPYYIEAISGDLEGERFDVDTAATIAASNSTVVLNTSSTNNTFPLETGNAVGSQFALRKHVTLSQIQSFFTSPLVGAVSPAAADQIWILNSSGAFSQYYLRNDLTTWRLTTGTTNVADTVFIPPGTGFIVQKRGAPSSMVVTGGVRVNDFAMPMPVGLSFRAPPYPISYSPASLGATSANGWTGSLSPAAADQLRLLNSSGTNFDSYYLRNDGVTWRLSTGTTNVADVELFNYDTGFLIARKTADTNYILVSPISL